MANSRSTYQDRQGGGAAAAAHPFVWVSLSDPSPEELAAVQREFGLPAPLVDGLATAARRPVLELTWRAAVRGGQDDHLGGRRGGRQARGGPAGARRRLRGQRRPRRDRAGARPPGLGGRPRTGRRRAVEEVEEAVFSPARARPTERIYRLSRQVLEFRRAVTPLTEMLDRLATESPTAAGERLKQRYRERRTHLLHLVELADGLGNLLSNVLQANLTEVSVRQNDHMRRISAWVAIWAIPTLLAGIHGMNFRHLPELEWAFGYPLVLVMMALICLGLYRGVPTQRLAVAARHPHVILSAMRFRAVPPYWRAETGSSSSVPRASKR